MDTKQLFNETKEQWYHLNHENNITLPTIDFWHQYRAEIKINQLIHQLFRHITHYHKEHHNEWYNKAHIMISKLEKLVADDWFISLSHLQREILINNSVAFYQRAKKDFPSLVLPDLFIGISNTVMQNYLRLLFYETKDTSKADYSVSMVLVLMQQLLLSKDFKNDGKIRLLDHCKDLLKDDDIKPTHMFEHDFKKAIDPLYDTLDDEDLALVFSYLNEYLDAYITYLDKPEAEVPYDQDLLSNSIGIGGVRGLLNGTIILPTMDDDIKRTLYHLGVIHQIEIDLFHASDKENYHSIFSIGKKHYPMDHLINKSLELIHQTLDQLPMTQKNVLKQMNYHYSWTLLYMSLRSPKLVSKGYQKYLDPYLHLPRNYFISLHKYVHRKYRRLKPVYHDTKTDEIIKYLLK